MALPRSHKAYPWIALVAGLVFLARAVSQIFTFSDTIDEPYHIASSVAMYEAHNLFLGAQHPPLARWVAGLPLVLQGVELPAARGEFVVVEYPGFPIGRELLASGQLPYWRMLISARLALLVFPCLSLLLLYRFGRWLGGARTGMFAVVFFSFDPTFLGHSAWVGTDGAGCAGFIAAMYFGLRWLVRPNLRRSAIAGVAVGLAIACKFSCVLVLPSLVLIALWRRARSRRKLPNARAIATTALVGFSALWATYWFDIGPMRHQAMFENVALWDKLPAILKEQPIPMPSLPLGYLFLTTRAATGQPTYLLGELSFRGWWYYYPVAIAVKSSIAFLVALAIALSRRWSIRVAVLLLPCAIYLALAMRANYQIGIRHLLPVIPLLYLVIALQLARSLPRLLMGLMLVAAVETAAVHPDYLSFFNIASGGAKSGEKYLIDSNLDWGQDIARLAAWLKSDEAKGRSYTLRLFNGYEPPISKLGLDPAALKAKPAGLLAISKNVRHRLDGIVVERDGSMRLGEDFSWVTTYPLVKKIGTSIDVYDLDAKAIP